MTKAKRASRPSKQKASTEKSTKKEVVSRARSKKKPRGKEPPVGSPAAKGADAKANKPAARQGVLSKKDAKRALARLTSQLRALKRDADENFWQIGRRLATASDLSLHEAAGYGSIGEYVEAEVGIGRAQAFVYMRVAGSFSESVATAYGVERLERGLRYIAKTPEDERPEDLLELRIPVPNDDGEVKRKLFEDCNVADLKRATSALVAEPARVPREVRDRIARADQSLDELVGEDAARRASVGLRVDASGDALVDVRGVPYAMARAVLKALSRAFPTG